MSSPTSAGSSWRSGTRHADNKEKMRGAEAVKGNIPSNVPPSPLPSACAPSLLSPLQPLNLYSQGCTPSRALRGEQEAGTGTGSLLSPRQGEAGMRRLPRRRWPLSQLWAWVKLTAMFKRPAGKLQGLKNLSAQGAQCENRHPADEHNNTHCAHRALHTGNN